MRICNVQGHLGNQIQLKYKVRAEANTLMLTKDFSLGGQYI